MLLSLKAKTILNVFYQLNEEEKHFVVLELLGISRIKYYHANDNDEFTKFYLSGYNNSSNSNNKLITEDHIRKARHYWNEIRKQILKTKRLTSDFIILHRDPNYIFDPNNNNNKLKPIGNPEHYYLEVDNNDDLDGDDGDLIDLWDILNGREIQTAQRAGWQIKFFHD